MKGSITVVLLAISAAGAGAQVGYPPERSPYRDLDFTREWTVFSGYYSAARDPVGVAPRSGAMLGTRFEMRLAGPTYVGFRVAGSYVDRTVIDPAKPAAERVLRTESVPLLFTDFGLGLNLTGHRSWRGMAPYVNGGLGVTADLRGANDAGEYRFGVPFTMTLGGGLKWISTGKWQVRLDWTNYFYQIRYPESYYVRTGEDDPVRLPDDPRSLWRRNTALTIGVSYLHRR